jgi:hypothetical protein
MQLENKVVQCGTIHHVLVVGLVLRHVLLRHEGFSSFGLRAGGLPYSAFLALRGAHRPRRKDDNGT